ncbi:MAG: AmmeMemoRadiSam system protein B, partial [Thermoguttaceae bacterium]
LCESPIILKGTLQMTNSSENQSQEKNTSASKPTLSAEEEQRLLQATARQVAAVVQTMQFERFEDAVGAGLAELPVFGAFVSLKNQGRLRSCCGYLGQSVSLADAVSQAAVRAAKDDPRFPPISANELDDLDIEVWLLWGEEEVLAKGEERVKEVVIGKHGLQISQGSRRGLLLPGVAVEYKFDARTFLQQTCIKAGLPPDAWLSDKTRLLRFDGYAIHGRLAENLAKKNTKNEKMLDHEASVAGTFYPATSAEVKAMLDTMLADPMPAEPWAAAMVPHAGWTYSGRLAAKVWQRVKIPSQVIIFCPQHRAGKARWAVGPFQRWLFPGGEIAGDPELARRLAKAIDHWELDAAAHQNEHAVEVQLPILARLAPQSRVVGVAMGGMGNFSAIQRFAKQMAGAFASLHEPPLLIISSDMNHFARDPENRLLDRIALDAIETLDPAHIFQTVLLHQISMCGLYPCVLVMETLRQMGLLNRSELVGYATSAEANGAVDRVVGYAGMLFA